MRKIILLFSISIFVSNIYSQTITEQKLTSIRSGGFGNSISISENMAVIAEAWENTTVADKAGAVYIYEYIGSEWVETQRLTSPNGQYDGIFGHNVATNEEYIIITEPNAQSGHIYYKNNSTWQLNTTFLVTDNCSEKSIINLL